MDESSPDEALKLYLEALDLYESEDREANASDVFRQVGPWLLLENLTCAEHSRSQTVYVFACLDEPCNILQWCDVHARCCSYRPPENRSICMLC